MGRNRPFRRRKKKCGLEVNLFKNEKYMYYMHVKGVKLFTNERHMCSCPYIVLKLPSNFSYHVLCFVQIIVEPLLNSHLVDMAVSENWLSLIGRGGIMRFRISTFKTKTENKTQCIQRIATYTVEQQLSRGEREKTKGKRKIITKTNPVGYRRNSRFYSVCIFQL